MSEKSDRFGLILRELRIKAGLSLRELAEKVSIDFTYLSKIENGVLPPPSDHVIEHLAEALSVDKEELLALAGRVPPDIAEMLKSREALQYLRSEHTKKKLIALSRKSQRETKPTINLGEILRTGAQALNSRNWARIAVSLLLVVAIGTSLWYASPTKAFDVNFVSLPSGDVGTSHSFSVKVEIADTERLPLESVNLYIYNNAQRTDYEAHIPNLPQNNTVTPYTSILATGSSGTAGSVSVTATEGPGWGFDTGTLSGYWEGMGTPYSWGSGYGYGYGAGATYITYNISWTPPSDWPAGTYKIEARLAMAGGDTFTKASGTFSLTVAEAPSGGGGTPTPTPTLLNQQAPSQSAQQLNQLSGTEAANLLNQIDASKAGEILNLMDAAKAGSALSNMDTTKATTAIGSMSGTSAGAALNNVTATTASTLLTGVDNTKTGAILTNMDATKASAVMELFTTTKLTDVIPTMSEQSLVERLPGLTPDKLYSIPAATLFKALPNVPTEQLISETPPKPPADLGSPVALYSTPSGAEYVTDRTTAGEWVVVVATPAPLDKLLIKTKKALTNVHTVLQITDSKPTDIGQSLPAGQVARAYVRVSFGNATPDDIELGHLTFFVEKSWLNSNSINKFAVALYRYDKSLNAWTDLPTKRISEDDTRVYYSTVITHFSDFAIAGSKTVPSAEFTVSSLSVVPAKGNTGAPVTISAVITNTTQQNAVYTAVLWVNRTAESGQDVSVPALSSKTVSFAVTRAVEGTYDVRIDRLFGSFSLTKAVTPPPPPPPVPTPPPPAPAPAAFIMSGLQVTPNEVTVGQSVTISTTVANTGDATGTFDVPLKVNNAVVSTEKVTLAGHSSRIVIFTRSETVAGTYTVNVGTLNATYTVKAAAPVLPPPPPSTPFNWGLLIGIVLAVIVIGLVLWFMVIRPRQVS